MDFGFSLTPSHTIRLDRVDMTLYRRLCESEPNVQVCMACGACSATCSASALSGMSLRRVLWGLQRGQDVRPMLQGCMLCGKCTMVCPRGINTRQVILTLCTL